jgi:hypothetical protein
MNSNEISGVTTIYTDKTVSKDGLSVYSYDTACNVQFWVPVGQGQHLSYTVGESAPRAVAADWYTFPCEGDINLDFHNIAQCGAIQTRFLILEDASTTGVDVRWNGSCNSVVVGDVPIAAGWSNFIPATVTLNEVNLTQNLTLSQTNISNVNEIYTNAFYFGIPDTSDYINFRYYGGFISYSYNNIDYIPLMSDWSHFQSAQDVDMGGYAVTNCSKVTVADVQQPLIQFGTVTIDSAGYTSVSLPVAYPSTYIVQVSLISGPSSTPYYATIASSDSFRVYGDVGLDYAWTTMGLT